MTHEEALKLIIETPLYKFGAGEFNDALDLAVESLEKQIPKKPKEYHLETVSGGEVLYNGCPNCKAILGAHNYYLKICACGQKIDWSE